ncbi:MAG: hypothetical protein FJX77_05265, partial [Armatimonadetes bacterium]|nr:hypothetical protein [Armatimonadota bacterium]
MLGGRVLLARAALVGLMAITAAGAQTEPEPEPGAGRGAPRPAPGSVVLGEITDLNESSFRIRPWAAALPKRVEVHAGAATRYYELDRTGRHALSDQSLALLVPERRP